MRARTCAAGILTLLLCAVVVMYVNRAVTNNALKGRSYAEGRQSLIDTGEYDVSQRVDVRQGNVKKVEIYPEHVYAFMSEKSVADVLRLHEEARKLGIEDSLNPILAVGKTYIKYPRCYPLASNTRSVQDIERDMRDLERLLKVGFHDYKFDPRDETQQNIMVCGDRLKVIDQDDPNANAAGVFVTAGRMKFRNFRRHAMRIYQEAKE